jgi:hypothetical protein
MHANMTLVGAPIAVSAAGLPVALDKVERLIEKRLAAHRGGGFKA